MVAPMAASLMMAARSAPENMGVPRAIFSRSTSGPSFTFLAWTLRISRRPLTSGSGTDLAVEAARADEGGVEDVGAVGGGDDDDAVAGGEAVHLDEDGVEGLLAFVVSAGGESAAAATADRVDLIEEDDAGGVVLGLLEEVADAAGADADEHLDEVRAGDREEGDVGLAGDGLGQEGLAAAGLADEQDAAGDAPAEAGEALGVLEELDDLGDFFLGLLDAGDVVEGDVGHFLGEDAVARLAEVAEHARPAAGVAEARDEDVDDDEDDSAWRRPRSSGSRPNRAQSARWSRAHGTAWARPARRGRWC
jgi:hypothetical protein